MSLFGSSIKYSQEKHPISSVEIKKMVTTVHNITLSHEEESVAEASLIKKKDTQGGKLSLQNIYEILHKLKLENSIGKIDYENLIRIFVDYYKQNFNV
ncbi:hypothetical protein KKA13_02820 [Patescibacteria group bacterium]|nr:hypothetical protein [Patescibacteria group bacterium]